MARIRTVKPELFQSYTVRRLSLGARWTFVGLLTHVDDDGYCRDEPRIVKGAIWPLEDEVTWSDVEKHIDEMLHAGLMCRFFRDGVAYLHVVNFREHQKINRATKSRLPHCPNHTTPMPPKEAKPEPDDTPDALFTEAFVSPHAPLTEDSCTEVEVEVEVERELEKEEEQNPAAPNRTPAADNFVPDAADADKPRGTEPKPAEAKPKRSRSKKPTPAVTESDPEAEEREKLAREILKWWWDRLDKKPAGKNAWHSGVAVIVALLKSEHEPKAIANAARAIGTPLTIPRMEIQLGKAASGSNVIQLPAQRGSTADQRVAQAKAAGREFAAQLRAQQSQGAS